MNSKDHAVAAPSSDVHADNDPGDRATPLSGTQLRDFMSVFPGRIWPNLASITTPSTGATAGVVAHIAEACTVAADTEALPPDVVASAREWAGSHWTVVPWWKWWTLDRWLREHPSIRTLIWVDAELAEHLYPAGEGPSRHAWTIQTALRRGTGIEATFIVPNKHVGITPDHLELVHDVLTRTTRATTASAAEHLPLTPRLDEAVTDLRTLAADFDDVPIREMTTFFYIHAYNQYDAAVRELLRAIDGDQQDPDDWGS